MSVHCPSNADLLSESVLMAALCILVPISSFKFPKLFRLKCTTNLKQGFSSFRTVFLFFFFFIFFFLFFDTLTTFTCSH